MLVQFAPGGVPLPHQAAGGLALGRHRRRAHERVLPAAAGLLLLLEVLRAALMQPHQLLQEGGALGGQRLTSADPRLQRRLGREAAGWVLVLRAGLHTLDGVRQPPGSRDQTKRETLFFFFFYEELWGDTVYVVHTLTSGRPTAR